MSAVGAVRCESARGAYIHHVASNLGNKFNWPGAQIKMVEFYGGSNQRILTSGNMDRNLRCAESAASVRSGLPWQGERLRARRDRH